MSKPIAFLKVAAIGAALLGAHVLPAGAADYEGGDDRPRVYRGGDAAFVDGDRARIERRRELRSPDRYRRGPGPVVFDERGSGFDRYGAPDDRRSIADGRFGYGRPAAFRPPVERPYGAEEFYAEGRYADGGGYQPAATMDEGAYRDGGADEGCTVDWARSITAAGWEKIVTRRTCYRR